VSAPTFREPVFATLGCRLNAWDTEAMRALAARAGVADAVRELFPAGSMTGAPKVEVMKAIEFYEYTARGAYAGCTGYIAPNGDFDFNVVIRTLLWNGLTRYLSFHTGGAVTFDSEAEAEYDECMLKARALKEVLRG